MTSDMRTVIGLFLLIALPGVTLTLGNELGELWQMPIVMVPFGIGAMIGIALEYYLLRRYYVIGVCEHELTHAVVALLLLRRVYRLVATGDRGGYVSHSGGFGGSLGDDLIGLGPYILPTFTAIGVLVRPVITPPNLLWYDFGIGVTFGYHLISTLDETRRNWSVAPFFLPALGEEVLSDIGRRGRLYSLIFILSTTIGIHGVLCSVLVHGYPGLHVWWSNSWLVTHSVLVWLMILTGNLASWIQDIVATFINH